MSTLTDYSSYDEVRATLGVSATEIPDTTLAREQYSTLLLLDLEDVSLNLPSLYTTVSAIPEVSRTATQQRFYLLARLFASYSCARTLLAALPLFAVSSLTDGRAEFQRADNVYDDVKAGVLSMYSAVKTKLALSYLGLVPGETIYAQTSFDFIVAATLGTDPVTGA